MIQRATNYMILTSRRFFLSRDVSFYEHIFPYQQQHYSVEPAANRPKMILPIAVENFDEPQQTQHIHITSQQPNDSGTTDNSQQHHLIDGLQQQQPNIRKSTRQRQTPAYLKDFVCHSSVIRTSPHNISKVMGYASLSPTF